MKKKLWLLLLPWFVFPALAQTDNTFYVKQFIQPNWTVGMATTAAQAACAPSITCIIVFDPSTAVYPQGTMPSKCSSCIWQDYRTNGSSIWNIGSTVTDVNSNTFLSSTAPAGWPFGAGNLEGYVVAGSGAGANLGAYAAYELTTTATFSSGATSMTVASAGTCSTSNPLGCVRPYMNISCAAGLASGTTVSNTYSLVGGSTTIPLSAATTANETNVSCTFTPGNTNGGIFLGFGNGGKVVASNGTISIGINTLISLVSTGGGGEDMNALVMGPNAAQGETGMWYQSLFNPSQSQTGAEFLALGNKVYEHGYGENSSLMMGTHLYCPAMGVSNLWIGPTACGTGWSTSTPYSFIAGDYSIFLGANMFGMSPVTPGTIYEAIYDTYVGSLGFGIWYNTGPNTIMGANFGIDSGTPTTLSTVTNSVFIESGEPASGGNGPFAANWVSGSGDIAVTAVAGTFYGCGFTTGLNNTCLGAGAGAAIGAGSYNFIAGALAAPKTADSGLTVAGYEALYDYTDATHGTQNVSAWGKQACMSEVNSAGLYCSGALSGLNETAADISYAGSQAGDRSAASAGLNSAFGFEEFYDTTGATGAEANDAFFGGESDCLGCTYGNSLGWGANIGAVAHATQIDAGTNSTANSIQFGSLPLAVTTVLTAGKITGCGTVTSPTGDGLGGSFAAGSTTCAPVITTGTTAPNGYSCHIRDRTANGVMTGEASSTATTATFPTLASVAVGDVISFRCGAD